MGEIISLSTANDSKAPRSSVRRLVWRVAKVTVLVGIAVSVLNWMRFTAVSVEGFVVTTGAISAEVMGTGTLEARISATISPKISGRIVVVLADQGDRVEAGQVLFRLDDADLSRQVEIAENTLVSARRAVERQNADVARANASLNLARIEHRRIEELLPQNSATSIELDRTTELRRMAEADLTRSEAALAEAGSQVAVASSTLDYQRARLADSVIAAPFAGLIARRDHEVGDVVVPGTSVFLILDTREMWISAWVDETEMGRLHPDQRARIVFRSEPERSFTGHVVRLGREADRETREFVVDVFADSLPENWVVGQRAEVYIETARATDVLTTPLTAVVWRGGQSGVFVENGGHAMWRPVRLGIRGAQSVEVQEGLAAGVRIITPASPTAVALRDGQRVKVR